MPAVEPLLLRLVEQEFEFVLIGGAAAVAYGVAVRTQDLDICCPFTADSLMRLQTALGDLHPVHRMTPDKQPLEPTRDDCRLMKNLYIGTDLGQLDCLSFVTGVGDYEAVKQDSVDLDLEGKVCRILSIDALIRSKVAVGGMKDIRTAAELRAIKQSWGQAQ